MDYPRRPATWEEYADAILTTREAVLRSLGQLRKALVEHFRSDKPLRLVGLHVDTAWWNGVIRKLDRIPGLPRAVVDEWGFVGEGHSGSRRGATHDSGSAFVRSPSRQDAAADGRNAIARMRQARATLTIGQHRPLIRATHDYIQPLRNFFAQAGKPLNFQPLIGRAPSEEEREARRKIAEANGLDPHLTFLSVHNLTDALQHLPHFQEEFRSRFARFVGVRRLGSIEREESRLLGSLANLWFQFVEHPEQRWRAAEVRAEQLATAALDRVREQIRCGLDALPAERFSATIVSESIPWEGRPALWLTIAVKDPLELVDGIQTLVRVLQDVFGKIDRRSAEMVGVNRHWEAVLVIPTFAGINPDAALWRFRPNMFYRGDEIEENSYAWLPLVLPTALSGELGIETRNDPRTELIRRAKERFDELWALVAHLADLTRIPGDVDDLGVRIADSYASGIARKISDALNAAAAALSDALLEIQEIEGWEKDATLVEIFDYLIQQRTALRPTEVDSDAFHFELGAAGEWATRLEQAMASLEVVRLARLKVA